ncbi:MAG: trypsin-like peptidase domain-containing protein [Myxococcota bacterium]|nr:trypsin-like peptidase domain-containing protein [Myxococcota bacterium]
MSRTRSLPLDALGVGLAVGFGLAVAAGAVASLPGEPVRPDPERIPADPPSPPVAAGDLPVARSDDPVRRTAVVEAVEQVAPAVVSITCEIPTSDPFALMRGRRSAASEGSGVVIDPEGIVLTNAHVVEGAHRIQATFADGRELDADVVGIAPELDLAVLRLRGASGLTAVPSGNSAGLMLGEPVIAIGNPLGLGHTVTTGVISAVARPLETDARVYQDFIQTDASINPGNSGGPLLDAHGRLVGINTAIRADAQGIGFAIPADRALKVAQDLVAYGQVQIAWLGVGVEDVVFDRGGRRQTAPRVLDGARETSTLAPGDVLLAVDGRSVQGRADLNAYLASRSPGDTVTVDVLRGGRPAVLEVQTTAVPDTAVEESLASVLGIQAVDRAGRGAYLASVRRDGAAARRGLRVGDVVLAVNGTPSADAAALREAIRQARSSHRASALFTVLRGDVVARLTLPI